MSDLIDIEAFAGPGGWSEGRRLAGATRPAYGIEWDMAACRTAVAAGHPRIRADVATFPLGHLVGKVDGLIMSPPCTTFSNAGHGAGRRLTGLLADAMTRTVRGENVMAKTRREAAKILRPVAWQNKKLLKATRAERSAWVRKQAVTSVLVVEPARWVRDIQPRWVALEQVHAVLPLWRHLATLLREMGYRAWAGKLDAECYGVPQTRDRAILAARRDGLAVGPPTPTHQAYEKARAPQSTPDLFGDPLPPPVSMADALGWGLPDRPSWTVTAGGTETGGAEVFGNAKNRATLRDLVLRTGNNSMVTGRTGSRRGDGDVQAYERRVDVPAPTLDTNVGSKWTIHRPATTVCGDSRIAPPGHRDREGGERQFGEQTVRVSVQEAALLQSFPADYPWQGTKSQQYRQVGDAVPPLLAARVLEQFVQPSAREVAA